MINDTIRKKYRPTIGIECHVQFNTKTKLFTAVGNDARMAPPNTLISPLCLGLPGTLPVLNEVAVEYGIRAGLAMNAQISSRMKFDRKHYFYPDLPKGYQITQYDEPIVGEGVIEVPLKDGTVSKIGIERAHLEEDAGKSTHPVGSDYSLVDLNRAGTPLLEIVSKPDMHSAEEAKAYAHELFLLMKYARVSEVDLFQGNMRFDVNVSVAPHNATTLGTRAEVKNLNSFKSIERATAFEIDRQIGLLEKGQSIVQETRGWDDTKQITVTQRTKEDAHDYRYFPEPDIPPYVISDEQIEAVRTHLPLLPPALRKTFTELGLQSQHTEALLDEPRFVDLTLGVDEAHAKKVASWLVVDVQAVVSDGQFDWHTFALSVDHLQSLAEMVANNSLSSTGAKEVLLHLITHDEDPAAVAKNKGLIQQSDTGEIEKIVDEVLAAHPEAAADVKAGEAKAIGFLVGQVMKASQGSANPKIVNEILRKKL